MTRETCQFFLEMGNKEETAVLVPGDANMEEMAGMDVLCSDKTGTLTFNKLITDKNLIEVFAKGEDETENQTYFCFYSDKEGGAESIIELYKKVHATMESTKNKTLLQFTAETPTFRLESF